MRPDVSVNATPNNDHSHTHSNLHCEPSLARAAIGIQQWREIYERDKALMRGTIFCELDKPFRGSDR